MKYFIIISAFLVLAGCSSVQYIGIDEGYTGSTTKVTANKSTRGIQLPTVILAVDGIKNKKRGPVVLKIGKHTFELECLINNKKISSVVNYTLLDNRKHEIRALDNKEGGCFFSLLYY